MNGKRKTLDYDLLTFKQRDEYEDQESYQNSYKDSSETLIDDENQYSFIEEQDFSIQGQRNQELKEKLRKEEQKIEFKEIQRKLRDRQIKSSSMTFLPLRKRTIISNGPKSKRYFKKSKHSVRIDLNI